MKKVLFVFLTLVLFSTISKIGISTASAAQSGDFTYSIFNSTAQITKYTGAGGAVTIPDTLGGYPVTSIGDFAFLNCIGLTSVTIPNSVTSIGYRSFYSCTGLTSLTIPNSVTSIGDRSFYGCTGLTSVTIPNSVTSMGTEVFRRCTGLTNVTISNSLTTIRDGTFSFCTGLTSVTIPSSVLSIGNYAFYNCSNLTSMNIPDNVTSIGDYAFALCTGLTSVTIPNSVTSIGTYAFYNCSVLTGITIPNKVTSIGDYTFTYCAGLTSVTIPNSVTSIGTYAFYGCAGLTDITIGSRVANINDLAFSDCKALTSAYFYGNAPILGADVFTGGSPDFKVYHLADKTGFTTPTWYGYPVSPASQSIAANAAIAAAKDLIPPVFTASEGIHTNLLAYLNKIAGMSDTGTTLTLVSSNTNVANDGTITYTGSNVTGSVEVHINKANGTEATMVMKVTVLAAGAIKPEVTLTGVSIDSSSKVVILAFSENIANNLPSLDALKSAVTFAANGIDFVGLGLDDRVSISGKNLVITFNVALFRSTNKVKIAANTIKDIEGYVLTREIITDYITGTGPISYELKPGESMEFTNGASQSFQVSIGGKYEYAVYNNQSISSVHRYNPWGFPQVINISPGDRIVLTNIDSISYRVFSTSDLFMPVSSSNPAAKSIILRPMESIEYNNNSVYILSPYATGYVDQIYYKSGWNRPSTMSHSTNGYLYKGDGGEPGTRSIVTNIDSTDIEIYGPYELFNPVSSSRPALAFTTVHPGESFEIKKNESINEFYGCIEPKVYGGTWTYGYAVTYGYADNNNSIATYYESREATYGGVWLGGGESTKKIVITNYGTPDLYLYGDYSEIQLISTDKPALRFFQVNPGESFTYYNDSSYTFQIHDINMSAGNFKSALYLSDGSSYIGYKYNYYSSNYYGILSRDRVVITNVDESNMTFFGPYDEFQPVLTDEPAWKTVTLSSGSSIVTGKRITHVYTANDPQGHFISSGECEILYRDHYDMYSLVQVRGPFYWFSDWDTQMVITNTSSDPIEVSGPFRIFKPQISGESARHMLEKQYYEQRHSDSSWADPVDTATGAFTMDTTLLEVYGLQPLEFNVKYNSYLLNNSKLGRGWVHNFETRLQINSDSNIDVHWDSNHFNKFTKRDNGSFTSSEAGGRNITLIKKQDGTFALTDKDYNVYEFDQSGLLTKKINRKGQSLLMSYNTSKQLTKVTEPVSGQFISITYNNNGFIQNLADRLNRQVIFEYDTSGNLTGITFPSGKKSSLTYDDNGRIKSITKPDSQALDFSNIYDEGGRVIVQYDAKGQVTNFSYDESSQPDKIVTTITERNGSKRILVHDYNFRLLSVEDENSNKTIYTYDSFGNIVSIKDPKGNIKSFTYDSKGNVLTKTDSLGYITKMTYDDKNNLLNTENPNNKKTTYTYDNSNNLIGILDPLGNATTFTYNIDSLLLSATTPGKGATTYTYQNGLLNTITDPTGVVTYYAYDTVGRKVSQTDALGKTTLFTYDNADNLTSITDPLGNKYSYTYDNWGNKLTQTDPKGNITKYAHDSNRKLTSVIDPLNYETKYEYDGEERLIKAIDPKGNISTITYDAKGRATAVTDPLGHTVSTMYDPIDNIISQRDALSREIINITYDSLNNPTITKDARGYSTTLDYDKLSRLTKKTDPKGQITLYNYDDLGRLTTVIDALQHSSTQGFDADGNQTSLSDPNNNKTTFIYDLAGRVLSEKTADGTEIKYTYDNRGLLTQKTNGRGQVTTYQYDDARRLISYTDPAGTVSITYDANGNILTIQDSSGIITMEYDELDRVNKYTDVWGNTIHYSYDAVGNLTTLTYPGNKAVNYEYDGANRLIEVTDWANRVTAYEYDANNRLTKLIRPDGSVEIKQYDEKGQLTGTKDQAADGTMISQYDYIYNEIGNIVEEKNAVGNNTLLPVANQTMVYGNGNRLVSYNGQGIAYDNDGNLTTGPLNGVLSTYIYDSRNRLINAGNTQYAYDALNNRIAVIDSGSEVTYVINPNSQLSQVLIKKEADGKQTYYVYGLGLISEEDSSGNYRAYHYDRRGSTTAITNESGEITDRIQYDAYGKVISHRGSLDTPFKYVGSFGVMNDKNGLTYMRARYYHPEIKRFVNKDMVLGSIEDIQSLNRFAYVKGNPVNYIDVDGQSPIIIAGAVVGAIYGVGSQLVSDAIKGEEFDLGTYVSKAVGGAAGGALAVTGHAYLAAGAEAFISNSMDMGIHYFFDKKKFKKDKEDFVEDLIWDTGTNIVGGKLANYGLRGAKRPVNGIKSYRTAFKGRYARAELWNKGFFSADVNVFSSLLRGKDEE